MKWYFSTHPQVAGAHHTPDPTYAFRGDHPGSSHIGNFITVPDVSSGSLIYCRAAVATNPSRSHGSTITQLAQNGASKHDTLVYGAKPSWLRPFGGSSRPSWIISGTFEWKLDVICFSQRLCAFSPNQKNLLSLQPLIGVTSLQQQRKKTTAIVAMQFSV